MFPRQGLLTYCDLEMTMGKVFAKMRQKLYDKYLSAGKLNMRRNNCQDPKCPCCRPDTSGPDGAVSIKDLGMTLHEFGRYMIARAKGICGHDDAARHDWLAKFRSSAGEA
jgi:hypothetical protein